MIQHTTTHRNKKANPTKTAKQYALRVHHDLVGRQPRPQHHFSLSLQRHDARQHLASISEKPFTTCVGHTHGWKLNGASCSTRICCGCRHSRVPKCTVVLVVGSVAGFLLFTEPVHHHVRRLLDLLLGAPQEVGLDQSPQFATRDARGAQDIGVGARALRFGDGARND